MKNDVLILVIFGSIIHVTAYFYFKHVCDVFVLALNQKGCRMDRPTHLKKRGRDVKTQRELKAQRYKKFAPSKTEGNRSKYFVT